MESQPQKPEFRINPENFHPCVRVFIHISALFIQNLMYVVWLKYSSK